MLEQDFLSVSTFPWKRRMYRFRPTTTKLDAPDRCKLPFATVITYSFCTMLSGNGNMFFYMKICSKGKRMLMVTVQGYYSTFAIFLTPLVYSLKMESLLSIGYAGKTFGR
jgi:hypothetical protein